MVSITFLRGRRCVQFSSELELITNRNGKAFFFQTNQLSIFIFPLHLLCEPTGTYLHSRPVIKQIIQNGQWDMITFTFYQVLVEELILTRLV